MYVKHTLYIIDNVHCVTTSEYYLSANKQNYKLDDIALWEKLNSRFPNLL